MKEVKMLIHIDSPAVATGFGNVARNFLNGIIKYYPHIKPTVLAINDFGGWKDPSLYPYKIYPASTYASYEDRYGFFRLLDILTGEDKEIKEEFDILFIAYDQWMLWENKIDGKSIFEYLIEIVPQTSIKRKIMWTVIDTTTLRDRWIDVMRWFDYLFVTSHFGKEIIRKKDKKLAQRTKVVYYPLDVENFYPTSQKKIIYFNEFNTKDKFVIGYVGRNQWRKDIGRLIKIFSLFKKKHNDAYLYLHSNPKEGKANFSGNFLYLLKDFGLYLGRDYAIPPDDFTQQCGIPRQSMNDIYNSFDVFLSCSTGEGFGLPYAEAMLAGVPVIMPDNTVAREFCGNNERCLIYKNATYAYFGDWDFFRERELGDINDALEKLEWVYNNREKAKEIALKGREFMLNYTIERCVKQFEEAFTL